MYKIQERASISFELPATNSNEQRLQNSLGLVCDCSIQPHFADLHYGGRANVFIIGKRVTRFNKLLISKSKVQKHAVQVD